MILPTVGGSVGETIPPGLEDWETGEEWIEDSAKGDTKVELPTQVPLGLAVELVVSDLYWGTCPGDKRGERHNHCPCSTEEKKHLLGLKLRIRFANHKTMQLFGETGRKQVEFCRAPEVFNGLKRCREKLSIHVIPGFPVGSHIQDPGMCMADNVICLCRHHCQMSWDREARTRDFVRPGAYDPELPSPLISGVNHSRVYL